jgi:hypothetical protein
MYIAAALVLPLGSITFNSTMIMGVHATVWTVYTISGLCVVLFGMFWAIFFFFLICSGIVLYRGVDWYWRQTQAEKWKKKGGGSYYNIPGFAS